MISKIKNDNWKCHKNYNRVIDETFKPSKTLYCFLCSSSGKESTCNAGDLVSIPGLGKSPGKGKGYPLQYSGLENSRNYTVHGVAKSRTRLSDFHFHICTWLQEKPGEENGNPLQYSCLENPMDRGAWQAIVRGGSRIRHELATKLPPPPQEKP